MRETLWRVTWVVSALWELALMGIAVWAASKGRLDWATPTLVMACYMRLVRGRVGDDNAARER